MLTAEQVESFEREGFLVVEDLVDAGLLADVKAEYAKLLDDLCQHWIDNGMMPAEVAGKSFSEQIIATIDAGLDYFQPLDISLPLGDIDADTPCHLGNSVFRLLTAERILSAVSSLIGPELTSCPIQHVRIKPPLPKVSIGENRAHIIRTDWHQDRAVALEQADQTRMITVWLAITEATEENGCLQVIPGSHLQSMQPHCPQSQLGIPESQFDTALSRPLPVPPGGAVLFHPLTIHGSLDNRSDVIRWSFDLRYTVTGQPTGRPQFPEFVALSQTHPQNVLKDADVWAELWRQARIELSTPDAPRTYHRWDGTHPVCA